MARGRGKRTLVTERRKRRREVERALVEGGCRSTAEREEMGARWGVGRTTIDADVRAVLARWEFQDRRYSDKLRLARRKELEHIRKLAAESYWRSRQDEIEITTEMVLAACSVCSGSGLAAGDFCPACDGNGEVMVEKVRKRVRGQAGDSSFLKVMGWTVVEQAKLEGLHVERKEVEVSGQVEHLHAHASITREDLARLTDDQLLELEAAQRRIVDGRAVEVEVVEAKTAGKNGRKR